MLEFGPFQLDPDRRELLRNGKPFPLQAKPFDTLVCLIEHRDRVVDKEELLSRVWPGTHVEESALFQTVSTLRKALGGGKANGERYIATVPGRGYQFVAKATPITSSFSSVNGTDNPGQALEHAPPADPIDHPAASAGVWKWVSAGLAAVLGVVTASALWLWSSGSAPPRAVRRFALKVEHRIGEVAISPNGRYLAYTQTGGVSGSPTIEGSLWLRDLQTGALTQLIQEPVVHHPMWSPKSDFVAVAVMGGKKGVGKVSVHGGPLVILGERSTNFFGGAWTLDGRSIVYGTVRPAGLYEIAARGGEPKLLFEPEGAEKKGIYHPAPLPARDGAPAWVYSEGADLQNLELMLYRPESGQPPTKLAEGFAPSWAPSGHILFYRQSQDESRVWALPFSIDSMSPSGEAFPIADTENLHGPSVSEDGTLAYLGVEGLGQRQLVWLDRAGLEIGRLGPPSVNINRLVALAPDGRSVAVVGGKMLREDIWIHEPPEALHRRFTFDERRDDRPVWSPDGAEIVFRSQRLGEADLFIKPTDGSAEPRRLAGTEGEDAPLDWSRNGQYIIFHGWGRQTRRDLWYIERGSDQTWSEPRPFLETPSDERLAAFSPDSRFVAYVSNESGRDEVYVRPFPSGSGQWQVSKNGGDQPRWSRPGSELFYVQGDELIAVSVETRPAFSVGNSAGLFHHPVLSSDVEEPAYDVAPDQRRFLLAEKTEDPQYAIQIIQNWYQQFRDSKRQ
jgi:serine/threonine-protein kinase